MVVYGGVLMVVAGGGGTGSHSTSTTSSSRSQRATSGAGGWRLVGVVRVSVRRARAPHQPQPQERPAYSARRGTTVVVVAVRVVVLASGSTRRTVQHQTAVLYDHDCTVVCSTVRIGHKKK